VREQAHVDVEDVLHQGCDWEGPTAAVLCRAGWIAQCAVRGSGKGKEQQAFGLSIAMKFARFVLDLYAKYISSK